MVKATFELLAITIAKVKATFECYEYSERQSAQTDGNRQNIKPNIFWPIIASSA